MFCIVGQHQGEHRTRSCRTFRQVRALRRFGALRSPAQPGNLASVARHRVAWASPQSGCVGIAEDWLTLSARCSTFPRAVEDSPHSPTQASSVLRERHLISTTKAADYLDASPGTIRQNIADGKVRCTKVGRLIKIDAKVLEALIVTVDNS